MTHHLTFDFDECSVPKHLIIKQVLELYNSDGSLDIVNLQNLKIFFANKQIKRTGNLVMEGGAWKDGAKLNQSRRSTKKIGNIKFEEFF